MPEYTYAEGTLINVLNQRIAELEAKLKAVDAETLEELCESDRCVRAAERERCERAVRELCPNPFRDDPCSTQDMGYTNAVMDACAVIRALEDKGE